MLKLKTESGQLTDYGFDCGYTESIGTPHVTATLKKMHGAYRIVGFVGSKWFIVNRPTLNSARRVATKLSLIQSR